LRAFSRSTRAAAIAEPRFRLDERDEGFALNSDERVDRQFS
jgi:hypothetical protein